MAVGKSQRVALASTARWERVGPCRTVPVVVVVIVIIVVISSRHAVGRSHISCVIGVRSRKRRGIEPERRFGQGQGL